MVESKIPEAPLLAGVRRLIAPRVTLWTTVAACTASVILTWFVSSLGHHGPFYAIGPFHVPVLVEWSVALGVVAAACIGRVVSSRRASAGLRCSSLTVAFLAAASALGTISWRAITSPGEGSNIGAGLLFLACPLLIAGLLHLALAAERFARAGHLPHFSSSAVAIWVVALCACVVTWLY